ncbi:L-seryl-tRNA selenium transferase [Syntrophomonas zehnderi OL-4]|uniref:L-seryl-tRNA(Sec) selenium transferase n=1 Tax=Syntrophomonas zehnderi OL-4 TaxID=690567 RepID=A0A0E4G989_9FIRM|nr:L-seryl-tRNA(Sec) selenium transferase [Syntrophomonas zehnderi]CFW99004.1 L-seryl-tRNA selenium transferase [Syntrophomonas zehnderi OL-4]
MSDATITNGKTCGAYGLQAKAEFTGQPKLKTTSVREEGISEMMNLRNIPAIDELLGLPEVNNFIEKYRRDFVVQSLRQATNEVREELRANGAEKDKAQLTTAIVERAYELLVKSAQGSLSRVINGTGVVLHTNLGRAPLGNQAWEYMQEAAQNYNNLEFDLLSGQRGSRYVHVEDLLVRLTGAEAALVVNNNAAAVLLGLTTLAQGKEVIVSRGQLVEIGGAFRIPEVMKASGAVLVEVGTTNRTYLSDYNAAINDNTGLLFAAHTSNYKISGFTAEVDLKDLSRLGQEKGIPVFQDLGSGILADLGEWGLSGEPTVQACVETGADIISFSGDKLLGGPQAGILIGKKKYIDQMKKNQLTRALRVDKLTIAALEGTLLEYLCGNPRQGIPVINMLTQSSACLQRRAEELKDRLAEALLSNGKISKLEVVPLYDMVGGGAYPTYQLPGFGVQLAFADQSLEKVTQKLRLTSPALLTRKQEDTMLISVRTLLEGEEHLLTQLLAQILL